MHSLYSDANIFSSLQPKNCKKLQLDILRSNEGHFPTKLYSHWSIQTMKCQKTLLIVTQPNLAERHTFWSLFVLIIAVFISIRWQRNNVNMCTAEQRQLSKPRLVFSLHMACRYTEATIKRACKPRSLVIAGMYMASIKRYIFKRFSTREISSNDTVDKRMSYIQALLFLPSAKLIFLNIW